MDRVAAQSLLTAKPQAAGGRFELAGPADAAEIRRLLRENPMGGAIRLSLEPAPQADPLDGQGAAVHQTIVGRRGDGNLFGLGVRSVRPAYVNGEPAPLGYLGSLRLDPDHRGSPRALLRGYEKLRELHEADRACRLYLTSIMADNLPARRFLEANVRGMPTYRFVGEFVSLVMRVRRRVEMFYTPSVSARDRLYREGLWMKHGSADYLPAITSLQERRGRANQFAPRWSNEVGLPRGLAASDFRMVVDTGVEPLACAALYDLRSLKQIVVRGYSPALVRGRWAINAFAGLVNRPRLPKVGEPLKLAYVSHLAAAERVSAEAVVGLVESLHAIAGTRDLDYLVAGFPPDDPRLAALRRRFGGRELRSRLYVVFWPDGKAAADLLDGRPLGPEVALL